jgi:DNA mismatch endonuclease (patch repair protein)
VARKGRAKRRVHFFITSQYSYNRGMDNVSRLVRSRTMAAVKSTGNRSTERVLRARLVRSGFRGWRMHARDVAGCPDFVFDEARVAVFVDGCFWHGCPACRRPPSSNQEYWTKKVARNVARDRRNARALRKDGWRVVRVWECALRSDAGKVVRRIRDLV